MNFHSCCQCKLVNMTQRDSIFIRYDIMSGDGHVGSLLFEPIMSEWMLSLVKNVNISMGFASKVWECLLREATCVVQFDEIEKSLNRQ